MQTRQQVFCEIKDHIMLIRVDNPETKNGLEARKTSIPTP